MTLDGNHPVAFDIGAIAIIAASFSGALPVIAAGFAALWYMVLIYDRFKRK